MRIPDRKAEVPENLLVIRSSAKHRCRFRRAKSGVIFRLMESSSTRRAGVIQRYREYLPVSDTTPIVSLGEGNTPLIPCAKLSKRVGRGCEVFVKYEGLNPTGSFKDRGMTVAVSKAVEQGTQAVICASTGNTSASAA